MIRVMVLGFLGGPLLLIAGGYAVAHWHGVIVVVAALAVVFLVMVVSEGVRQQRLYRRRQPVFDTDAAARAAFVVEGDAVGRTATDRFGVPIGPKPAPARRVPRGWRAADFDDLQRPR